MLLICGFEKDFNFFYRKYLRIGSQIRKPIPQVSKFADRFAEVPSTAKD